VDLPKSDFGKMEYEYGISGAPMIHSSAFSITGKLGASSFELQT
jgi:hypothetical protein